MVAMRRDEDIEQLISTGRVSFKGWVRANCPFCLDKRGTPDRRQSFGVNVKTGWYECYRCATRGRLRGYQYEEAEEQEEVRYGVEVPEGFYPLAGSTAMVLGPARDYLFRQRKVSEDMAASLGIGACISGRMAGRVVVPILGNGHEWLWYVARSWRPKADVPYLYPQGNKRGLMFNAEALSVRTSTPALVVEGVFDAIPHWPNAVAVLGKTTDDHVCALAASARPVVMVPDGDEWESGYAISLRLRLAGHKAASLRLPPGLDPDCIDPEILMVQVREAIECNL
jgi:hypothetical protein